MPGRKVRDEVEARRFLDAVACSGLERADWARQHGIDARSLNAWRLVVARKDGQGRGRRASSGSLEFLELVPTPLSPARPAVLGLHLGDILLEVPADFDDDHLRRVLQVVLAAC